MKRLLCLALLSATPACASALIVLVEPKPFWTPSPAPTLSPTPTVDIALPFPTPDLSVSPTLTPEPEQMPEPRSADLLALLPFEDRRTQKLLFKGRAKFQDIEVRAQDFEKQAAAWKRLPYGDMSLLWQRQLAYALADSGLALLPLADPEGDDALDQGRAADLGAKYALTGKLKRLDLEKRGADFMIGTSFTGFKYTFRLEAEVNLIRLAGRTAVLTKDFSFEKSFHDDQVMGAPSQETFPLYFREGLLAAATDFAADAKLRGALGLAVFTPTPTVTVTPTKQPTRDPKARTATITPTPTPASFYINPKTGKAVSDVWNFDPEDGTPRRDFVLVDSQGKPMLPGAPAPTLPPSPTATPTPTPTQLP